MAGLLVLMSRFTVHAQRKYLRHWQAQNANIFLMGPVRSLQVPQRLFAVNAAAFAPRHLPVAYFGPISHGRQ